MKKQLMTILTVVLALAMIFTLAACEKKPDPNGSEPAPNKTDLSLIHISLVSEGGDFLLGTLLLTVFAACALQASLGTGGLFDYFCLPFVFPVGTIRTWTFTRRR